MDPVTARCSIQNLHTWQVSWSYVVDWCVNFEVIGGNSILWSSSRAITSDMTTLKAKKRENKNKIENHNESKKRRKKKKRTN